MINAPKGTKDVLPDQSHKWQYIENTAREVARVFCLKEVRTPAFEYTELFKRGVGETTDVVGKEMYTFEDKGGRSITLKPEGTAGVARTFIENGLASSPMPLKTYYITPAFRYERPQAGRLREFHQFGIEIFGAFSVYFLQPSSLQSSILRGFLSNRVLQVSHISSRCGAKYSFKALLYSARQVLQPMELISSLAFTLSFLRNDEAAKITSASVWYDGEPNTSIPNWWNSLSLPDWGRS